MHQEDIGRARICWSIGNETGNGEWFPATNTTTQALWSHVEDLNRRFGEDSHWIEFLGFVPMRHPTDTPKIQAHQPEIHMDDLTLAQQANEDALFLLKAIDDRQVNTLGIDISAIRKRVTLRHYQMVARLAETAKTAEKQ
jgi:hypothetical protein